MGSIIVDTVKGGPGKPSHPPLTDATIGAFTVGVAMLVLGALGVEEPEMAHGALLAIGGGIIVAVPTALTGLLDWLDMPSGTRARTVATIHMLAMVTATALFVATWLVHLDGYDDGTVETLSWVLGLAAEGALAVGGFLGGTIVYVYGNRVLARRDTPVGEAVNPMGVSGGRDREPPGSQ